MSEKHTLAPVFGTTETERSLLDPSIWSDRFKDLDQGGKCMAEYVWIGGTGVCVCVFVSGFGTTWHGLCLGFCLLEGRCLLVCLTVNPVLFFVM